MNCSRCAAELPDSSTFCSRCGAANPSSQLTASAFSYLPAGAPPWPTSAPARSAYATLSAAPPQITSSLSPQKSGRSVGKMFLIGVLVLLVPVLIGVGGTAGILAGQGKLFAQSAVPTKHVTVSQPTATAGTTAQGNQLPTPASFKTVTSQDVNASFQYPSDWVQDAVQKSTSLTSLGIGPPQDQRITVRFSVVRYSDSMSATLTSPDMANQALAQGFGQQNNLTNQQTAPFTDNPPTAGGTWAALHTTYLLNGTNQIDLVVVSVLHNKDYYSIYMFSSDSYFSEAMQKYIEPMYSTFKFLA